MPADTPSASLVYYVELVEDNDWEGERWSWWIPEHGNHAQLEYLRDLVSANPGSGYKMGARLRATDLDTIELAAINDHGYFDRHNRLDGFLDVWGLTADNCMDELYKGGILGRMRTHWSTK